MTQSFRFMALGAFLLLGAAFAQAQDAESVHATIPFSFKVGKATLPPGEYTVRLDFADMPGLLRVGSQDGRQGAFVLTEKVDAVKGSDQPRLIFDKNGDTYVLTEVVGPGAEYAVQILGTHPSGEPEPNRTATD